MFFKIVLNSLVDVTTDGILDQQTKITWEGTQTRKFCQVKCQPLWIVTYIPFSQQPSNKLDEELISIATRCRDLFS